MPLSYPFLHRLSLIHTRLTLWIIVILASSFVLFVLTDYLIADSLLLSVASGHLYQNVTSLADALEQEPGANLTLIQNQLDAFSGPESYIQYQNPAGKPVVSSNNMGELVLPLARLKSSIQNNTVLRDTDFDHGEFMMYGHPVIIDGHIRGYVLGTFNIEDNATINLLLNLLTGTVVIMLTLATIFVWLLVRHMLRPLEHLADAASHIATTSDHALRLQVGKRPDEINRLTRTINGMLQSLEDAYKQVQHANDLQRRFLADISHELRTPLTIMLSSLDLMKKEQGRDPEFHANALDTIHGETQRMARMVTRLLILVRTDANVPIVQEPLLIIDIITDACRQCRPPRSTIEMDCQNFDLLEDAVVSGHADYLKQVLLILLENAYKYTGEHGKITVAGTIQQQNVMLSITDTGIGIPSEDLPGLFERFYRASNARTQPGTGLGLSIARSIIEQHNGSISVESTSGQGSCFTIILPLLNETETDPVE